MDFLTELREEGARQCVPVSVPPRAAHIVRERVQHIEIAGGAFYQIGVIVYGATAHRRW